MFSSGKAITVSFPFNKTQLSINLDAVNTIIKSKLNSQAIRHSPLTGKKIKTIAVLGGSGSFAIADCKKQNVDAFITADLKYHQFYEGEKELLLIDIGPVSYTHLTLPTSDLV